MAMVFIPLTILTPLIQKATFHRHVRLQLFCNRSSMVMDFLGFRFFKTPATLDNEKFHEIIRNRGPLSPPPTDLLPKDLFGAEDREILRTSNVVDRLLEISGGIKSPLSQMHDPESSRDSYPSSGNQNESSSNLSSRRHSQILPKVRPARSESSGSSHGDAFPDSSILLKPGAIPELLKADDEYRIRGSVELAENTEVFEDITVQNQSPGSRLPGIFSFQSLKKRHTDTPAFTRLNLGSLKPSKTQSLPRPPSLLQPIGSSRPRSDSGSLVWLPTLSRERSPSESGRQFDAKFDPLDPSKLISAPMHPRRRATSSSVFDEDYERQPTTSPTYSSPPPPIISESPPEDYSSNILSVVGGWPASFKSRLLRNSTTFPTIRHSENRIVSEPLTTTTISTSQTQQESDTLFSVPYSSLPLPPSSSSSPPPASNLAGLTPSSVPESSISFGTSLSPTTSPLSNKKSKSKLDNKRRTSTAKLLGLGGIFTRKEDKSSAAIAEQETTKSNEDESSIEHVASTASTGTSS